MEKACSLLDPAADMVYNGIAIQLSGLPKEHLLVGTSLANPMHQDVGAS